MTSAVALVLGVAGALGTTAVSVVSLLEQTVTGGTTDWERLIGNFGFLGCFFIFFVVLGFKLLPHIIEWLKGQTAMSGAVTQAMPAISRLTPEEIGRVLRQIIAETRELDHERVAQLDKRIAALTDRLIPK